MLILNLIVWARIDLHLIDAESGATVIDWTPMRRRGLRSWARTITAPRSGRFLVEVRIRGVGTRVRTLHLMDKGNTLTGWFAFDKAGIEPRFFEPVGVDAVLDDMGIAR